MQVYVKKLGIVNLNNLMIIGLGQEGLTYKYNDLALKIHYRRSKQFLSEDIAKHLIKFETDRILMPQDLIYDENGKYVGYTKKYVKYNDYVREVPNDKLIEELKKINNDIKLLSHNGVLLDDINNLDNIVYDGGINFVDPGFYTILDHDTYSRNLKLVADAIYHLLMDTLYYDDGQLKEILKQLEQYNFGFFDKIKIKNLVSVLISEEYKKNKLNYIEYLIENLTKTKNLNDHRLSLLKEAYENGTDSKYCDNLIQKIKSKRR